MSQGKVKWFNNAKGYGFVIDDNGGDDLFVHYSYINCDGYKTLKSGQRVSFEIQEAPSGRHAIHVDLLDYPMQQNDETPNHDYNINLSAHPLLAAEPSANFLTDNN
jgi:CspA family cold shock protein